MYEDRAIKEQSWAATTGIAMLALSSLVGCARPHESIPEKPEQAPTTLVIKIAEDALPASLAAADRAFLEPLLKLEEASKLIRANTGYFGWRGTREAMQGVSEVFPDAEKVILDRIDNSKDSEERWHLHNLFETVHLVHSLLKEDGFSFGRSSNYNPSTMPPLYEMEARLVLMRHHVVNSEQPANTSAAELVMPSEFFSR